MLCVRTTQRSPRALPSPSVSRRWISSCGTVRRRRSTWPVSSSGPSSFGSTPPPGIVARSQATWRRSSGSAIASRPASARTLERRSTRDSATFASPRTRGTCPPPPTMRPGWAPACDTSSRGSQSGDREARLRLRGGPPKIERVSAGPRGTMLDHLVKGGTVIDGTGAPGRRADVGIRDGRIVAVAGPGTIDEPANGTIDADGLVVTPGFVDPHTHYDAQLFWDPLASPSTVHGVTTIANGNCGFTLAPLAEQDADYLRRMMARVEGMPLPALENGVPWNWSSFGNEATQNQIDEMVRLLHESIDAGGIGFSTTLAFTHSDGDGKPVASRWASKEEVLALCGAVRDHEGTTLEYVTDGCMRGFRDDEVELMADMPLAARRTLNWNVLTVDAKEPERYRSQLAACENAAARGGKAIALTMPILVEMNMNFRNYCALFMLPGWNEVMNLPVPERME